VAQRRPSGRSGWWARTTPVGRAAVRVAVGMGAITLIAVLLGPWLWPRWEAYLGARLLVDPDGALALQRAVGTALLVWLAAVTAAGATLLVDWWLDRPKR
jgi:hypothetical protein